MSTDKNEPTVERACISLEKKLLPRAQKRADALGRNFSNYIQYLIKRDLEAATAERGANK